MTRRSFFSTDLQLYPKGVFGLLSITAEHLFFMMLSSLVAEVTPKSSFLPTFHGLVVTATDIGG